MIKIEADKIAHFRESAFLTALFFIASNDLVFSIVAAITCGVLKEVYDFLSRKEAFISMMAKVGWKVEPHTFDWYDLLADAAGVLATVIYIYFLGGI